MYVVISHHYVTKEYLSVGRQALDEMHQEMQHYEGFIERHNLIADRYALVQLPKFWSIKFFE